MSHPQIHPIEESPEITGCPSIEQLSTTVLKTLIIDDSSFDRRRIIRECTASWIEFDVTELAGLSDLRATLDAQTFDVILIDYRLNDGDGLAALNTIFAHPDHMTCATIMITGDADSAVAVNAMKAGCSDYMEKSQITTASINRAVMNAVQKSRMQRDITTANGMKEALARVLDKFAADCVVEMKPLLSRMLRQVRNERSGEKAADARAAELEGSCKKLWTFLEDIETYSERFDRTDRTAHDIEGSAG